MAWVPEEEEVYIVEGDTPVEIKFAYVVDGESGGSYEGNVAPSAPVPPDDFLTFRTDADGFYVTVPLLEGMFPIQFIDYVTADNQLVRINSWQDLPEGDLDIVSFRPDEKPIAFAFTVTVAYEVGDTVSSRSWELILRNDWTGGQQRLMGEIDARS